MFYKFINMRFWLLFMRDSRMFRAF